MRIITIVIIVLCLPMQASAIHTEPSEWSEPRAYHDEMTPELQKHFDRAVTISKNTPRDAIHKDARIYGPNGAYWVAVRHKAHNGKCLRAPCDVLLYVFNETNELTRIRIKKVFGGVGLLVQWINEKLLYVEPWWNTKEGVYFIYDVESESIIRSEPVFAGDELFRLHHE